MMTLTALLLMLPAEINWGAVVGGPKDVTDELKAKAAEILNTEYSYSETCSDTIAACLGDPSDKNSPRVAGMVLRQLKKEREPEKIRSMITDRGKIFTLAKETPFDLPKDTTLGSDQAALTIVEFADFQCPFCAEVSPFIKNLVETSNGRIRIHYNFFPLKGHERALDAGCAALAAARQGKFFDYHNILYKNRHALSDDDLVKYARDLGLNLDAFNADRKDKATIDRIRSEKRLGSTLGVDRTPTLFFNGKRLYLSDLSKEEIEDRIAEMLEMIESEAAAKAGK